MAILTFEVKGQTLTVKSSIGRIVENSINYLEFKIINNDNDWKGLTYKAIVSNKIGNEEAVYPTQGEGIIPKEKIKAPGFQISLLGYTATGNIITKQITTNPVFIAVAPSGEIVAEEVETQPVDASESEKINNRITLEINGVNEKITNKESTINQRISDEISGVNKTIDASKKSLQEDYTSKINQLKTDLYGGSDKEKTLEGSIEDEIKQNKNDIQTLQDNTKENKKDIEQFYSEGIVPLSEFSLRDYKIVYNGDKWVASTDSGGYKHSLIRISPNLIGKRIKVTSSNSVHSEIAFLTDLPDYSTEPPYVEGTALKKDFVKFEDTIPSGTSWLYISRRKLDPNLEMAPVKLEIEGYDYCEGVISNLIKADFQGKQNQIDEVKSDIDNIKTQLKDFNGDMIDLPLSAKYRPFTTIVNDCQDITKWTSSDNSLNADEDHIMWNQSLHCTGQMRCTKNTYDLLKNDLVLKLRINSIETGHTICIRLSNTATPTEGATYYLMTGAQTTPYGDWREIVIPYSGYKYKSNNIDFSTINDIHIYADNVGTSGALDGVADWNVQYIGLRPRNLNKGIISFTFDDGYKTQYTGAKLLAEKGITSTVYHIVDATGIGDILTVEELQEMVDYYNTDIEVHGDIPRSDSGENGYNALTNEELIAHWSSSQKFLRENGLSEGRHMSYPGNYHSNRVVRLAKKYFDSCRTIQYYIPCESYPPADHHRLRAVTGVGAAGINVATVKKYIDQAMASGAWLILTFHRIGDVPQGQEANASMYCSESDLQAIADYAIESGAIIKNIAEVYNTTSIHL